MGSLCTPKAEISTICKRRAGHILNRSEHKSIKPLFKIVATYEFSIYLIYYIQAALAHRLDGRSLDYLVFDFCWTLRYRNVISYALGFLIYDRFYTQIKEKQILSEILTYTLIFTLILVGSFLYYISETINGDYNFYEFLTRIYLPTLLIFIPLLLLARWVVFYFYDRNTANSAKRF